MKSFKQHHFKLKTDYKITKVSKLCNTYNDTNNIICDLELENDTIQTFIKISPLIDPVHYIKNNLHCMKSCNTTNFIPDENTLDIVKKINSKYNSSYIESFMGFLLNKLIETNICIGFPKFYTSFTAIKENAYFDITEDYNDIKFKSWFKQKKRNNLFLKKTVYDDFDDDDSDDDSHKSENSIEDVLQLDDLNLSDDDDNSLNMELETISNENKDDVTNKDNEFLELDDLSECDDLEFRDKIDIIEFPEYPVNACVLQKCNYTLDELIDDLNYDISEDEWISILFQIIFNLLIAQKHYKMCHNDLHSSNIMFEETDIKYIYYSVNGIYYKIETFGKIVKVIDFGRASFCYNGEWFISDVFNGDGDAEGQFNYPEHQYFNPEKTDRPINYSFDIVRLATTIYERFDNNKRIRKFLDKTMMDDFDNNVIFLEDDFSLYIHISRHCHNAKPSKLIKDSLFKDLTINKLPNQLEESLNSNITNFIFYG